MGMDLVLSLGFSLFLQYNDCRIASRDFPEPASPRVSCPSRLSWFASLASASSLLAVNEIGLHSTQQLRFRHLAKTAAIGDCAFLASNLATSGRLLSTDQLQPSSPSAEILTA